MQSLFIKNGTIITLGESNFILEKSSILLEDNIIKKIGKNSDFKNLPLGIKIIDASDKLIMPGFINMHMHFYSTFARGIIPKQPSAKNFKEILEKLWWPLDNTLNEKDIYYSTMVAIINGIKAGTTTFFDHHESQNCQEGVLDIIEKALNETGMRGNLCLGISDRYGKGKEGINENIRFIKKLNTINRKNELVNALFGFHAAFTVNNKTMNEAISEAKILNAGFHIHIGEDVYDQKFNMDIYKKRVVERLYDAGCLGTKTLAIHGIHVSDKEIRLLSKSNSAVIHNPQSNMNNAVGIADILKITKNNIICGLGSDGMSSGLQSDVRTANLIHKINTKDPRVFFSDSCQMLLNNNAKIANRFFQRKLGSLVEGNYADIVIVDYIPPTPLNKSTFFGHFLFGICESQINSTIVNGKILMHNKKIIGIDEKAILSKSREQSKDFWKRF